MVTDSAGKVLYVSKGNPAEVALAPIEREQIPLIKGDQAHAFNLGDDWESVGAIYTGHDLRGYAWVEFNQTSARELLASILDDTILFGIIWIVDVYKRQPQANQVRRVEVVESLLARDCHRKILSICGMPGLSE